MLIAGKGDVIRTKREDSFVAGALRCLASETSDYLKDSELQELT